MSTRRALEKLANLAKAANLEKVAIMPKFCQGCLQSDLVYFLTCLSGHQKTGRIWQKPNK